MKKTVIEPCGHAHRDEVTVEEGLMAQHQYSELQSHKETHRAFHK